MATPVDTSGTQLPLLRHISKIVSSDRDVESILQELVTLTSQVTNSDACLVYLVDRFTNEIVLRESQLPHHSEIGSVRMKMGEGITGWVAAHRSAVVLSRNASADVRFKTFSSLQEDTYEALLSVPLIDSGEIIGVINVHHKAAHQHTRDQVALVSFIGEQIGGLIARGRLAERSRAAMRRMKQLVAVAQSISAGNYLKRILSAISEMLADSFHPAVSVILIVDDEKKELTVSAAYCSVPGCIHKVPILMEGTVLEYVIRQCRPIIVSDIHREKRYRYPELTRKAGLTSVLAVPLSSRSKVIGSINIYARDERSFSDDEVGFATVVAGQAAIALQNARLMSESMDIKRTLEAREIIERAKAIIQRKYKITEEEAYLRMRNKSSKLRRSMRDLAETIILADAMSRNEEAALISGGDEDIV